MSSDVLSPKAISWETLKGCRQDADEAAPYVVEYLERKRLSKLGYTSPLGELCALKAEIFVMIDVELDKLQSENSGAKHGRR